jgi:hypothetical protein
MHPAGRFLSSGLEVQVALSSIGLPARLGAVQFPRTPFCWRYRKRVHNGSMSRVIARATALGIMLAGFNAAGQRRLTLPEAERFARAALRTEDGQPPHFSLEPPPIAPQKGAMFHVRWANSALASSGVHAVLIDIDTGEAWDPVRCEPISTPDLISAQGEIRDQLRISAGEVDRARALAKHTGCSNLIDERPDAADFGLVLLTGISTDEQKAFYRYAIRSDDVLYIGMSRVQLKVREGNRIRFKKTRTMMYVIDDDGKIQQLYNESDLPPVAKR